VFLIPCCAIHTVDVQVGHPTDQGAKGDAQEESMDARRADGPDANEIAKLVGPMWSEAKVCDALGIEAKALATRREEGTVLVPMMSDGVRAYPISQFQRTDGAIEVRPALIPFLTTLRHFDPWTVAVLLQTPAPELEDKTPFDWLGIGGDPKVLEDLARTVSSEWSVKGHWFLPRWRSVKPARWRSRDLPGDGHGFCPRWGHHGRVG
jgi:hypothetical protein